MNLDINNPEHNPEEIWGKFYFNYDKKQHFFSIHSKHGFIVEDVATFWGVRKDKVQDIIAVDHTYELLLKSWEQCGWIKSETHFMNINKTVKSGFYRATPEGIKVAREWKKKDKQEKIRKRQINRYGMPLREFLFSGHTGVNLGTRNRKPRS